MFPESHVSVIRRQIHSNGWYEQSYLSRYMDIGHLTFIYLAPSYNVKFSNAHGGEGIPMIRCAVSAKFGPFIEVSLVWSIKIDG